VPAAVPVRRAVLVSDLHLVDSGGPAAQRFLGFIEQHVAPDPDCTLVIAGDLFDFCYGLPGRLPGAVRGLVDRLEALPSVVWLEGNHDFWLERALVGSPIDVRARDVTLRWGEELVYVQHGDLIQLEGRLIRALFHSPVAELGARLLGVEGSWLLGNTIGQAKRRGAGGYDGREPSWLSAAQRFARLQRTRGYDLTVLGHGHWMGRWEELFCLGDWLRYFSYLELGADGEAKLLSYEPPLP
jgi:hypothetical protein